MLRSTIILVLLAVILSCSADGYNPYQPGGNAGGVPGIPGFNGAQSGVANGVPGPNGVPNFGQINPNFQGSPTGYQPMPVKRQAVPPNSVPGGVPGPNGIPSVGEHPAKRSADGNNREDARLANTGSQPQPRPNQPPRPRPARSTDGDVIDRLHPPTGQHPPRPDQSDEPRQYEPRMARDVNKDYPPNPVHTGTGQVGQPVLPRPARDVDHSDDSRQPGGRPQPRPDQPQQPRVARDMIGQPQPFPGQQQPFPGQQQPFPGQQQPFPGQPRMTRDIIGQPQPFPGGQPQPQPFPGNQPQPFPGQPQGPRFRRDTSHTDDRRPHVGPDDRPPHVGQPQPLPEGLGGQAEQPRVARTVDVLAQRQFPGQQQPFPGHSQPLPRVARQIDLDSGDHGVDDRPRARRQAVPNGDVQVPDLPTPLP